MVSSAPSVAKSEAKAYRVVGSDVVSRVAYRSASTQASVKCQVVVCQLQQICL